MNALLESKNKLFDIIEELCEQRGITIAGLCRETGIRPGLFSDLKSGKALTLSMESIRVISDYFKISTDVLFDR